MSIKDKSALRTPPLGRRLRLGFVGGGRGGLVGEWHFSGARLSNHWDVVAGALSSRPDNAAASARDWMIAPDRSYTDFHDMALRESQRIDGIEAVTICTPNWSHAEIASAFLKAGIDVILDKPMTTTVADAESLVKLAHETGLCVVMTYPYTYHAMAQQARALIAKGAIGAVRHVHLEYLQDWNMAVQPDDTEVWRQDPQKAGRSMIVGDIGTHAYHLLHTMTGEDVAELRADMFVCGGAKPQPDTAHINFRLGNGAPGFLMLTNAAPGQYCGLRIRIWGTAGAIEWDQEKPEYLKYIAVGEEERNFVRGAKHGVLPEAERYIHLPRGHGEALTDAWGNLYAEAGIAIACRRSSQSAKDYDLNITGPEDGLRGMVFIDACADSFEAGGVWTKLKKVSA